MKIELVLLDGSAGSIYHDIRARGELFYTNGCSIIRRKTPIIEDACILHDLRYHNGGTTVQKDFADNELLRIFQMKRLYHHWDLVMIRIVLRTIGRSRWGSWKQDLSRIHNDLLDAGL